MDKLNDSATASLNDQLVNFGRNYIYNGFADHDSWEENTSQCDEDLNDFDGIDDKSSSLSTSCYDHNYLSEHNSHAIDFTLHTIVEESCEDSELEYYTDSNLIGSNAGSNRGNNISWSTIERCFDFGFEDQHRSNIYIDDCSSDIFSDLSESVQTAATNYSGNFQIPPTSRLEKYFLSEFMGFVTGNKSGSSVSSDSEGHPSSSQRKKKLMARRTPRSINSFFDNFLVEPAQPGEQSNESFGFSESDTETFTNGVVKCDKQDNNNCNKRKKKQKKRELFESTKPIPSVECKNINWQNIKHAIPSKQEGYETNKKHISTKTSLGLTDSYNNWSSDEEINVMMSKMRTFFKPLIHGNPSNRSSNIYYIPTVQYKAKDFQFPYSESDLIRLMKKVPCISNQQLREIVEYFNSEVIWFDSSYSSDLNLSCLEISFITDHKYEYHNCKSEQTEQLLVDIYQHIGQKLVNLMREDNIGPECKALPNIERIKETSIANIEAPAKESLLDKRDGSLALVDQQQGGNPRSKSNDTILGNTNRYRHSYSNKAVSDNTGESSDCDRFSWRGSFESALLAPEDSRDKLVNCGLKNSSHTSQWSLLKRASVDNLWCRSVQKRNPLDRVQSCGSILGNNDKNNLGTQKVWLSSFADLQNESDVGTSFKRTISEHLCTNSLPGIQLLQYAENIPDNSKLERNFLCELVKSARYRSPAVSSNISCLPSLTKGYKNKIQRETYSVSCLQQNINFKSSLARFKSSKCHASKGARMGME